MPNDPQRGSAAVIANLEALIGAVEAGSPQADRPRDVGVRDTSMLRQRALDRLASLKKDGE